MVTFGGSGSLLACRLVDILGLDGVLVPLNPGNLSAYGLLTVDVRNDYVQTSVARADTLDVAHVQAVYDDLGGRADAALEREGFAERGAGVRAHRGPALLRPGLRGARRRTRGPVTRDCSRTGSRRFHDEHRALYSYDFRDDPRQQVEWVNLRVTGVGPIRKPSLREVAPGTGAESARTGTPPGVLRRLGRGDGLRPGPARRRRRRGGARGAGGVLLTVPLHPGFAARRRRSAT